MRLTRRKEKIRGRGKKGRPFFFEREVNEGSKRDGSICLI